jgi:RsiW-degrading membrane proteinase PrsW (M82 family)
LVQRLSTFIISIYITAFLYANIPFVKVFSIFKETGQLFWNSLAIFIIILVPVYFLVNRYIYAPSSRGIMVPIRAVLLTLVLIGLVLTVFYHIIPLEPIYDLPSYIDQYFTSDTAFTIWLLIPLAVLFI